MPLESGRYLIVNVKQNNLARLPDPNDETALMAWYDDTLDAQVGPLPVLFILYWFKYSGMSNGSGPEDISLKTRNMSRGSHTPEAVLN